MKLLTIIFVSIFTLATTSVLSGEVTDTEWENEELNVTYYTGESGNKPSSTRRLVECTAFNYMGKAIGGGNGIPRGGVARVRIQVPKKYVGNLYLTVKCK